MGLELAQKPAPLEQLNREFKVGKSDEQDVPEQERHERAAQFKPNQDVEQNKPATNHKR